MALKIPTTQPAPNATDVPADDDPPEDLDIPLDRWGRRLIEAPDGSGEMLPYWRASGLGKALISAESDRSLINWELRATLWGASRCPELVRGASARLTVGNKENPQDKAALDDLVKQAKDYARTASAATQGTALHSISELLDAGHDLTHLDPLMRRAADTWRRMVDGITMHLAETFVVCDAVRAAGRFDRLVSLPRPVTAPDGTTITPEDRLILDLKSNRNREYWGKVYAAQQAVYVRGVPYWPGKGPTGRHDWPDGAAPNPRWSLIPWVPLEHPDDARWVWVDIERGFRDAQLACEVRLNAVSAVTKGQFVDATDLVVPPAPADPVVALGAHPAAALLEQIRLAETPEQLEALYDTYAAAWTAEHSEAANAQMERIEFDAGQLLAKQAEERSAEILREIGAAQTEADLDRIWSQHGQGEYWTERHLRAMKQRFSVIDQAEAVA